MKTQVSEFKKSALTIKKEEDNEEDKEEDKEEDSAKEVVKDMYGFLRQRSTIIFIYRLFQNFLEVNYMTEIEEMCEHKR